VSEDEVVAGNYPVQGGAWEWFEGATTSEEYVPLINNSDFTLTAENVSSEAIEMLAGTDIVPAPEYAVKLTTTAENGNKIEFVLYRVQFAPLRFNYWNKWYKKLAHKLFGPRIAYWLFYRNALKINYSGKALMSDTDAFPKTRVGRLK
jgi:hypothetical protein